MSWYLYNDYKKSINPFVDSTRYDMDASESIEKLIIWLIYINNIVINIEDAYLYDAVNRRTNAILNLLKGCTRGKFNYDGKSFDELYRLNGHFCVIQSKCENFHIDLFSILDKIYCFENSGKRLGKKDDYNMELAVRSLRHAIAGKNYLFSMAYVILGEQIFKRLVLHMNIEISVDIDNLEQLDYYVDKINELTTVPLNQDLKTFRDMIQRNIFNELRAKTIDEFRQKYTEYEKRFEVRSKRFKDAINEYISINKTKTISLVSFLDQKGISYGQYKNIRKIMEEHGLFLDKLKELDEVIESNHIKAYNKLIYAVEKNLSDIQNGMTYLDYIKRGYRLSEMEELIKNNAVKSKFSEKELLVIRKWINSNRSKDKDVRYHEQMSIVYKNINGDILYTNEMKQQVFDYMSKHKIPCTIGAFKGLLKELKDSGKLED